MEPVILDITREDGVAAIAGRIIRNRQHRRWRTFVNKAGVGIDAPLESALPGLARTFEFNMFGQAAAMLALRPALAKSRETVVSNTSVGSKVSMAAYGAFLGSKYALGKPPAIRCVAKPPAWATSSSSSCSSKSDMAARGIASVVTTSKP
jgi:short-subunit dehydrogenase